MLGKDNLIRTLNVSLEEHGHGIAMDLSRSKMETVAYFECMNEEGS